MRRDLHARIAVRALVAIALVCAGPVARADGGADPGDAVAEAAFHAAEARLARGDLRGATDAFVAIADASPRSIWADDALAEGARGAEQGGELVRAVALWRRIAEQYPDSRQARRAQARL